MNSSSERVASQRSAASEHRSQRAARTGSLEPVEQQDQGDGSSQQPVSTAISGSRAPESTVKNLTQQSGRSYAASSRVGGDRICCLSVFVWAMIYGFFALLLSIGALVGSFFALNENAFFESQQVVTIIAAVVGIMLGVAILANAFAFHRSVVYLIAACVQVMVAILLVAFGIFVIFIFAVEYVDCGHRTGDDCLGTAIVGLAVGSIGFFVVAGFEGFFAFVLFKATMCQKQDDGYAIW